MQYIEVSSSEITSNDSDAYKRQTARIVKACGRKISSAKGMGQAAIYGGLCALISGSCAMNDAKTIRKCLAIARTLGV